MKKFYIGQTIP